MELTEEQREALDTCNPKQRAFVLAYCGEAAGNATEAARIAEYKEPGQQGHRLLKNDHVRRAIELLRASEVDKSVMTIGELREFWSRIARGEELDMYSVDGSLTKDEADLKTRMRASELLGKSQGAFLDKVVVETGPNLGAVVAKVGEILARKRAREEDE